jgi:dTDP-4-amino-4,6-dideoxygalactose transaminase
MSQDAWRRFSDDGYRHYDVVEIGYKFNMMDLQAAIGMHQIERIEAYWQRRRQIWDRYMNAFASLPVRLPGPMAPDSRHALHLYTVLLEPGRSPVTRDEFLAALHRRKIGTGVHYRSIPAHPVYQEKFGWKTSDYPSAEAIGNATVSLPLTAKLSDQDVSDVIRAVHAVLDRGA